MIIYYAESLMTRIDTLSDLSIMQQMRYVEFLCFIARIAHQIYDGTKQESQGLHIKIDMIMTPLFDAFQQTKLFTFKADGGDEDEDDNDDDDSGSKSGSDDEDEDGEERKKKKTMAVEDDVPEQPQKNEEEIKVVD